jgi:Carboxypeptidase regulatory-like domain
MRLRSCLIRVVALSVLSSLFPTIGSRACSVAYSAVEVGKEFQVQVTNHGKPIRNLQLAVTSNKSATKVAATIYAKTDVNGYAHFSNLATGSYFLKPVSDTNWIDGLALEVTTKKSAAETVSLAWPGTEIVQVRSASGTMRGPDFYPRQNQVSLSISLSEGITGHMVGSAKTDSDGRFHFQTVPAGIYFLHLSPSGLRGWSGEEIEGTIAIEVSSDAQDNSLDLDLNWSSCGLGYGQRVQYPETTMRKACGDVVDTEGAAISKADVFLLKDDNAEILQQARSDQNGQFSFQAFAPATYQLLVKSAGFLPSIREIHIEGPQTVGGCPQPVHIRLSVN